jgi:uncharacterized membrane protein (DUF2068 family)
MPDRELRACGWHGHVTFRPDEPALAARIRGDTPLGEVWRCLRCGSYVLGPPAASGPAESAPVPARGRALRQLAILRLLAAERIVRALVLVAAAYGVYRFAQSQGVLRSTFTELLPAARPLAARLGIDLDQSGVVKEAGKALGARTGTLWLVAAALLAYGVLEAVEGVGLWLARRWGEYLTVVATAAFLPVEIRELLDRVTTLRLTAFAVNVAAVAYLVVAKRLFGVRGGRAGYERELRSESLLEVEAAGRDARFGHEGDPREPGRDAGMSNRSASGVQHPRR